MEELLNKNFIKNSLYVNPLIINKGILVVNTYSPRGYINKEGGDESAWLPGIILCEASKDAPVLVHGRSIIAQSPASHFELIFTPSWNKEIKKEGEFVYLFENSFFPDEKDEAGNIFVHKYELTGNDDGNIVSGSISYSGIDNRVITLHGEKNELENMIMRAASNFPSRNYDLKFSAPCCASSNKYYNIKINNEEIDKFAEIAVDKLSFYPSFL